jgi:hypothetical protein
MTTNLIYAPVLDAWVDLFLGFTLVFREIPAGGFVVFQVPLGWVLTCDVVQMGLPFIPGCSLVNSTVVVLAMRRSLEIATWVTSIRAKTPSSNFAALNQTARLLVKDANFSNLDANLEISLNPTVLPQNSTQLVSYPYVSNFTLWWAHAELNTLVYIVISFDVLIDERVQMILLEYPPNFGQGVRIGSDLAMVSNQGAPVQQFFWRRTQGRLEFRLNQQAFSTSAKGRWSARFAAINPGAVRLFTAWNFWKLRFCINTDFDNCDSLVDVPVAGYSTLDSPRVAAPDGQTAGTSRTSSVAMLVVVGMVAVELILANVMW